MGKLKLLGRQRPFGKCSVSLHGFVGTCLYVRATHTPGEARIRSLFGLASYPTIGGGIDVNIDRLAADLQGAGLSEEETEVYLRLLRTGETKVRTLTSYFDVSRSKLYRLLDGMVNEGTVKKSLERPTRYEAVDPELVIRDRLTSLEQECDQLEDLLDTAVEPLREMQAEGGREIDHHWTRIQGTQRIFEALQGAARNVEERIWWASTNDVVVRLDLPPVDRLWKTASGMAAEGTDTRLLLDLPQPKVDEIPRWLTDEGLEIRERDLDRRPVDFALLDDVVFLWTRTREVALGPEAEAMTVRTNAPGVRAPLAVLFDEIWAGAEPLGS